MLKHRGFSLLEILVAFAIMAVALTIVLRIFGSGISAATQSEEYTVATQIAESLMARVGVETPLQIGEMSGIEGDKYNWRIVVSPLILPLENNEGLQSQQAQQATTPLQLMAVKVSVGWGEDMEKQRSVELNTLRLFRETTQ